jgi:hypothetical protein
VKIQKALVRIAVTTAVETIVKVLFISRSATRNLRTFGLFCRWNDAG